MRTLQMYKRILKRLDYMKKAQSETRQNSRTLIKKDKGGFVSLRK